MLRAMVLERGAYGSASLASLVADFFELRAYDRPLYFKSMVDYLDDTGIRPDRYELVSINPDDHEILDDEADDDSPAHGVQTEHRVQRAHQGASRVLEVLRERKRFLNGLYPYAIDSEGTLTRKGTEACPYDVAMTMTLRHGCLRDHRVANEFEAFVERCLKAADCVVFPLAAEVRKAPGGGYRRFRTVFEKAKARLIISDVSEGDIPKDVHDHGVDLLVRSRPLDRRPGVRTTLIQATVGKCDSWTAKVADPPRGDWSRLLGDPLRPVVTLAVPHHIENEHLRRLVSNWDTETALDRLRLVAHEPNLTKAEFRRAQSVLDAGAEE